MTNPSSSPAGPDVAHANLTVDASRCSHQRIAHSRCQACVDVCPRAAWSIDDEGLTLDIDDCDGCGHCVVACPQEALSIPAPAALVQGDVLHRRITLACTRAALQAGTATTGTVACLHGVSPEWLLLLARQHRTEQVRLASGQCEQCQRAPLGPTLDQRWEPVALRLGSQAPRLEWISAQQWAIASSRSGAPDLARRRFFGGALSRPAHLLNLASTLPGQAMTSGRHALVLKLAQHPGAAPMWRIVIDADLCSACMACVNLCPEHAMEHGIDSRSDPRQEELLSHPERCIGCELCVDACDDQAVRIDAPIEPDHEHGGLSLPLTVRTCIACKQTFRRLSDAMVDNDEESNVCPTCRRGKLIHAQRIVQQPNP